MSRPTWFGSRLGIEHIDDIKEDIDQALHRSVLMAMSGPDPAGQVETRFFDLPDELLPFKMRSGETLAGVRLAYEVYGEISPEKDNVVLLFHALTGSQHAAGIQPRGRGGRTMGRGEPDRMVGGIHRAGPGGRHRSPGGDLCQLPGRVLRHDRPAFDRPGNRRALRAGFPPGASGRHRRVAVGAARSTSGSTS